MAIGWSSKWSHAGSILVESKMSVSDFHRDKRKKHKLRIGRWRYFLCPVNVLSRISVELHYPDHGLLYLDRGRVHVIREAPQREDCNLDAEIRLLRFALVHLEGNLLQMGFSVDLPTLTKRLGIAGLAPSRLAAPEPLWTPSFGVAGKRNLTTSAIGPKVIFERRR